MDLEEAVEILEGELVKQWDEKPVVSFENVEFDESDLPEGESFCHFQVMPTFGDNFTKCGDSMTYKQYGLIKMFIYVPVDEGSKPCWEIADRFNKIFVNRNFKGIRTYTPDVSIPAKSGSWYGCDVGIEFEFNSK